MTILDQIKEHIADYMKLCGHYPNIEQNIHTDMSFNGLPSFVQLETTLITCKDCKHAHMTMDGKHCKWCSIMATHSIDGDLIEIPSGYDPEPYFDANFFCGYAEPREEA